MFEANKFLVCGKVYWLFTAPVNDGGKPNKPEGGLGPNKPMGGDFGANTLCWCTEFVLPKRPFGTDGTVAFCYVLFDGWNVYKAFANAVGLVTGGGDEPEGGYWRLLMPKIVQIRSSVLVRLFTLKGLWHMLFTKFVESNLALLLL